MVAGWIGQGSYYGMLVLGGFLAYRVLFSNQGRSLRSRFRCLLLYAAIVLFVGPGLSAAALLPRLDINQQTNLAGGGYSNVEDYDDASGTTVAGALKRLLAPDFKHRRNTVGAITLVLALVGAVIAWRRTPVPYFAIQTLVVLVMTLRSTPLH